MNLIILFGLFIIHVNSHAAPPPPPLFTVLENKEQTSLMITKINFSSHGCLANGISSCLNGGLCVETTGSYNCLPHYSGPFCEILKKN